MYETSCTCEILHWTPHVHRLKLWTGSLIPAASWTFFTIWDTMVLSFIPVHVGPCWHILCSIQTRRNCVQVLIFLSTFVRKIQHLKKKIQFIYTGQIRSSDGTPAWSREGEKKKRVVLVLLTYLTLVCCSMKLTAVVLFIHMNTFMKYVIEVNYTFTL